MKKRPIFAILLACILFLEPLIRIIAYKVNFGFEWETILANVFSVTEPIHIFNLWLLFPVMGILVYLYKNWSYWAFISLLAYALILHLTYKSYTWPYISEKPFFYSYIIIGFCIFLAVYFFLPDVRRPYLIKTMRWWEQAPRFDSKLACEVLRQGKSLPSEVLNISQTGCFVSGAKDLNLAEPIHLRFSNLKETLIEAVVVSSHQYQENKGFGVKFVLDNDQVKNLIQNLVTNISKENRQLR